MRFLRNNAQKNPIWNSQRIFARYWLTIPISLNETQTMQWNDGLDCECAKVISTKHTFAWVCICFTHIGPYCEMRMANTVHRGKSSSLKHSAWVSTSVLEKQKSCGATRRGMAATQTKTISIFSAKHLQNSISGLGDEGACIALIVLANVYFKSSRPRPHPHLTYIHFFPISVAIPFACIVPSLSLCHRKTCAHIAIGKIRC